MLTLSANVNDDIPGVASNDIYLDGDGNISLSVDLQAVLQACSQAAQTLLGEMIYNTDQGIPYFQTLWVGVPNIQQFTGALRAAFLAVPNVVEVVTLFTSQVNNPNLPVNQSQSADILTYTAVIRTIYGSAGLTGTIPGSDISG